MMVMSELGPFESRQSHTANVGNVKTIGRLVAFVCVSDKRIGAEAAKRDLENKSARGRWLSQRSGK